MSRQDAKEGGGCRAYGIEEDAILHAWKVLCPSGRDTVTRSELLRVWRILEPQITPKDVQTLVGGGGLQLDDLIDLMLNSEIEGVDPLQEAFRYVDPNGTGHADREVLKRILSQLVAGPGCSQIDDDDMDMLTQSLDVDKDGQISLQDFAALEIEKYRPTSKGKDT